MNNRRSALIAIIGTLTAAAVVHCFPAAELQLFAQGAAKIASLFTSSPIIETDSGWLLPLAHQNILVSKACSGATFFIITCSLLSWHISQRVQNAAVSIALAFSTAFALSVFINALRIICLVQAHRWLIPLLPENYAAFTHLLVGVAVFLPSLIALNACLEFYGHAKSKHRPLQQSV